MAVLPTLPAIAEPALPAFVRLAACPQCAGRRRVLHEVAGRLVGRCLGCGFELPVPLGTERHHRESTVGRGGQAIVEVVAE